MVGDRSEAREWTVGLPLAADKVVRCADPTNELAIARFGPAPNAPSVLLDPITAALN